MKPADLDAREKALAEITREAGELARRLYLDPASLGVKLKGKQDYITLADYVSWRTENSDEVANGRSAVGASSWKPSGSGCSRPPCQTNTLRKRSPSS